MQIWVDADACPKPVKEVLFRAAERTQVLVTLVANQYLPTPRSSFVTAIQVEKGFDVADDEIVKRMTSGDLVITGDIPLADEVISKGGVALNPRGTLYSSENIKNHLQRRDMMEQLRDTGMISGGPDPYGKKELQNFANALDKQLAKRK